jgi:hypothetical protein
MAMARPIASGYVRHSATRLSSWLPTIATCGEVATRVRNVPHSPKASGGRERSHPARNRWAVSWLCQVGNGIAGLRCEAAQPSAARSGAMPSRAPSNWATPRDARGLQRQQSASRSNARRDIVNCRSPQDRHRSGSWLLDALQQCIGASFGDPIDVLDHNDLPPSQSGSWRNGEPARAPRARLGSHQRDVGMRAGQRRTTCGALPAAARAALQRGGEGARRI